MNIDIKPINMKKTFIVKDMLFNSVSRKKGTLEYYLIDELGDERKVTAIAELGFRKKIKKIRALYQRETPLINALAYAEVDQTITVDFSDFNKKPRQHKKLNDSSFFGLSTTQNNFNTLFPDVSRVPLLTAMIVFGTLVVFLLGVFQVK